MTTIDETTWQEMERLRDLGTELGGDPLQLAVEELARYKDMCQQLRDERGSSFAVCKREMDRSYSLWLKWPTAGDT
jgi:hypothetical protein